MSKPATFHACAVLFDLDGTLLDALEDIARSANEVLEGQGFPANPRDAYRQFIGCASGEPLLAAHATIGAWPKGGEPWHRRRGTWGASRTGGRSWRAGGVADCRCGPSAGRRASTSRSSTGGGGSSARPSHKKPAFLPVHVVTDQADEPATRGIEVVLANGRCLRVGPGFDPHTLVTLVDLLEARGASC